MAEIKKKSEAENTSKKSEIAVTKKKSVVISKSPKKTVLSPASPLDVWQAFDDAFARFRSDFEDLIFPTYWADRFPFIPETRVPAIDLEDRGKDFLVKAEMPGFKKEDIEIETQEDSIAITGLAGWKYDAKGKLFICKERACKTFFRRIDLPEEIKVEEVDANLAEGVLEIVAPKKAPKEKRKVAVK